MAGDYAGDISPGEALALLRDEAGAVLVDVRTQAEWSSVGVPDLSSLGQSPVFIEWQTAPPMGLNPQFVPALQRELRQREAPLDAPVLFLCRSGGRSRSAARAMTEAGYGRCLNVVGGFEGGPDPTGQRGMMDGWKAQALPWTQA